MTNTVRISRSRAPDQCTELMTQPRSALGRLDRQTSVGGASEVIAGRGNEETEKRCRLCAAPSSSTTAAVPVEVGATIRNSTSSDSSTLGSCHRLAREPGSGHRASSGRSFERKQNAAIRRGNADVRVTPDDREPQMVRVENRRITGADRWKAAAPASPRQEALPPRRQVFS
jgi:hypothetical protein